MNHPVRQFFSATVRIKVKKGTNHDAVFLTKFHLFIGINSIFKLR